MSKSQHVLIPGVQEWATVGAEAVAKMTPSAGGRLLGANSWSVLLLPRITLGLAFFRPRFYFSLLPLLDVLRELLVGLAPVLGARRPRPRRVHAQSFAEP